MPTPPITDELLLATVEARGKYASNVAAAAALGIDESTLRRRLARAAERGLSGTAPVMPGYMIKSVSSKDEGGAWIKQTKAPGEVFELPAGQVVKGVSALVDQDGREVLKWVKTRTDADGQMAQLQATIAALKEDLPRISFMPAPPGANADLLNQFVVTDSHFGMLAWREETGADYDLRIAEQLLTDWFAAAIDLAPDAHTAVLAQLCDLMHHDALESVTPAHRHVLDADSRLQKVIRVVIRTIRRVIDMLLQKHVHVHVVMASGNHDPASSAWLREMLAAMYEHEPRITVDNSPGLYYAFEWGETALMFHHGHRRGINNVDATLAGTFRALYGRSKFAYAHVGHLHSDEGRRSGLMYVERHETLAAPDAYAAGGGWLSGRSAKVITYHKRHGEVARQTLRPEMVSGAYLAANDNHERRDAA
jgi:hypothetical protein